jgi:hypothetical protein
MNVQELILNHYKSRDFIQQHTYFIENPQFLPELIEVAQSDLKYPFPQYASWWLFHIGRSNSSILIPFQSRFIDCVLENENVSVLRNTLGILLEFPLIDYKEGFLLDRLFQFLQSDNYKVAIQVYALYLLINFTKKYPEIKQEILEILKIKEEQPHTPALKMGIKNYLKATKQIN